MYCDCQSGQKQQHKTCRSLKGFSAEREGLMKEDELVLTESVSGDRRQGQNVVSHRLILDYLKMNQANDSQASAEQNTRNKKHNTECTKQ